MIVVKISHRFCNTICILRSSTSTDIVAKAIGTREGVVRNNGRQDALQCACPILKASAQYVALQKNATKHGTRCAAMRLCNPFLLCCQSADMSFIYSDRNRLGLVQAFGGETGLTSKLNKASEPLIDKYRCQGPAANQLELWIERMVSSMKASTYGRVCKEPERTFVGDRVLQVAAQLARFHSPQHFRSIIVELKDEGKATAAPRSSAGRPDEGRRGVQMVGISRDGDEEDVWFVLTKPPICLSGAAGSDGLPNLLKVSSLAVDAASTLKHGQHRTAKGGKFYGRLHTYSPC
jgi:hypothetical protein